MPLIVIEMITVTTLMVMIKMMVMVMIIMIMILMMMVIMIMMIMRSHTDLHWVQRGIPNAQRRESSQLVVRAAAPGP